MQNSKMVKGEFITGMVYPRHGEPFRACHPAENVPLAALYSFGAASGTLHAGWHVASAPLHDGCGDLYSPICTSHKAIDHINPSLMTFFCAKGCFNE